jgi:hypothetical protein
MQANPGAAEGGPNSSPDALLPLFIRLFIRVGNSVQILCKLPQAINSFKISNLRQWIEVLALDMNWMSEEFQG